MSNSKEQSPDQVLEQIASPRKTIIHLDRIAEREKNSEALEPYANVADLPSLFQKLTAQLTYEADPDDQLIRTPARLLKDGKGNCVDFTTFIAALAKRNGWPLSYRVTHGSEFSHIYPLVDGVPVDLAFALLKPDEFKIPDAMEMPFTHCDDYPEHPSPMPGVDRVRGMLPVFHNLTHNFLKPAHAEA